MAVMIMAAEIMAAVAIMIQCDDGSYDNGGDDTAVTRGGGGLRRRR